MNMQHVFWAQSHDWFKDYSVNADGSLRVHAYDVWTDKDGMLKAEVVYFDSFDELKVWAGY